MTTSTIRISRRFFAIGGRFLIDPDGKPDFGINFGPLFSLNTPEPERRRLLRITRAARSLVGQRSAVIDAMVRQSGKPCGAWIVWEGH